MKTLIYIILTLSFLLFGFQTLDSASPKTSIQKVSQNNPDFQRYINSLDNIKMPFKTTLKEFDAKTEQSYLYKKFKLRDGFGPCGIAYQNKKHIVIMEVAVGDASLAPIFSVFSMDGIKTDSLKPYSGPMDGEGFKTSYSMILEKDFNLTVIDSSWTFEYGANNEIIESSKKLEIEKNIYALDQNGKILKK